MKKQLRGTVTSDKNDKTRRVEVMRKVRHPMYGKIVNRRTICHVHDEKNESQEGDVVDIIESRPHSKLKRWELVAVVSHDEMSVPKLSELSDMDAVQGNDEAAEETAEEATSEEASADEAESDSEE
ncbi:30S ribosomal protein S17 [Calycomorphotria hydatis]|uniref:Small ribosomal subunit protein uS17 n=1 Tax=Calycomorphotria hydatis TaxID=2528027 RepID=A0A517T896_9PLAN|nr:30S ribosomal protein S17 [Calycomorphotria hydatis]